MGLLADLVVKVGADVSGFKQGMGEVGTHINELGKYGAPLALGIGAGAVALGALGVKAVQLASQTEQAKVGFTTMLGSAQAADSFIRDLKGFAASTPFEFNGLRTSASQLLAMGFNSQQIIPMLTSVGDAVWALGGGQEKIDRVTMALGQMKAKGKVSADEMLQLTEAGIPAWQFLADKIGKSVPEAMKLAEKGAVTSDQGIAAVQEGMNKRYGGLMKNQMGTVGGLFSNLQDIATQSLTTIGEKLIKTFDLKGKLGGLTDIITMLSAGNISGALRKMFGPEVASALEKVGKAFGALKDGIGALGGIVGPIAAKVGELIKPFIGGNLDVILVAVAGILGGVMVAALIAMAAAAWAAAIPIIAMLAPFIAIGAAVAIVAYVIYSHWGMISGFLTAVWGAISGRATAIWTGIRDFFVGTVTGIRDTAVGVFNGIVAFFTKWGALLLITFMGPFGFLVVFIKQHWAQIWDGTVAVFTAVSGFLSAVWGRISSTASGIWNGLVGIIMGPVNRIRDMLTPIWDGIKKTATDAWSGLIGAAGEIFGRVGKAIGDAIGKIHIPTPSFTFGEMKTNVAGVDMTLPTIGVHWNAAGGIFNRPTVLQGVGESGAEAVAPIDRLPGLLGVPQMVEILQSIDRRMQTLERKVMGQINVTTVGSEMDPRDLVGKISWGAFEGRV